MTRRSAHPARGLDRPTLEAMPELQRRPELATMDLPAHASMPGLGVDWAEIFVAGSARRGGAP